MNSRDSRLNTPSEMLDRLVYVSRPLCFFTGFFVTFSALAERSPLKIVAGVLLFGLMLAGHEWLRRRGRLAELDRSLDRVFEEGGEPADELDALLERREALESRRGEPGFDPWAVQAVRREISDYVNHHPEARRRLGGRR